ncbi:winged helix-turn-helix domain-containing protein [Cyanobacterium sp. DS4]|uniref:winged helix-turn-helix domain-containing protein n=1 Tax=Cyanobacterium sp. DS4 TaxID=2878255 RepID=UPI003CD0CCAC|nr:winged helix-turn-helix domain-containing protein [Cyanobacterium sp. Dongsha4]
MSESLPSIPSYQSLMLPILTIVADGSEYKLSEVRQTLENKLGLSNEQLDLKGFNLCFNRNLRTINFTSSPIRFYILLFNEIN